MSKKNRPQTPDGRYFVSRNRLKRCTNPQLDDHTRRAAIKSLMQARHAVMRACTDRDRTDAQEKVDAAKLALGERGAVWWTDGAPDDSGLAPDASSYAGWWANLTADERAAGRA